MYLSKIMLKPCAQTSVELVKLTRNGAYSAHQLLWRLFTDSAQRNFIFRQDIHIDGTPIFYVLSSSKPSHQLAIFNVQTKVFAPQLRQGQRLGFKLRANPSVCITHNGKQKRHDVLMHTKHQNKANNLSNTELQLLMNQAAQGWLANTQRLKNWGISLDFVPEIEAYHQYKSRKKQGQTIQFSSVDYQGVLTITHPEKFYRQYQQGFGRAKSLGCGLMLIRSL